MHFFGVIQGSIGATSALACLLGAVFLIYTQIASWRIIAGVFLGMVATSLIFNLASAATQIPMFAMPWYWHLVLGGFAFGMVFMATDPVTACMTDSRALDLRDPHRIHDGPDPGSQPGMFPEGIMLAILFANLCAPLIDYAVVRVNVRRPDEAEPGGGAHERTLSADG